MNLALAYTELTEELGRLRELSSLQGRILRTLLQEQARNAGELGRSLVWEQECWALESSSTPWVGIAIVSPLARLFTQSVLLCLAQAKGTHRCRNVTPRPLRAPHPPRLPDRRPVPRASPPLHSAVRPCPRALRPSSAARPPRRPARPQSHSAARPCRRRASRPVLSAARLCHPAARPRSPGRRHHRGRGRWPSVSTPSRPATTPRPASRAAAATRSWRRGRPTLVPPPPGYRPRLPHFPSPAPMAASSTAGRSARAEPLRASACALRSSHLKKRSGLCRPARPVPKRAPSAALHSVRASPSQSRLRPPPMPTLSTHSPGHPST